MWLRRVIRIVGAWGVEFQRFRVRGVLALVLEWRIWRSGLALQSWELWFCVSLRVHVPNNYVLVIFVIAIRVQILGKYMIIGPLVFRGQRLRFGRSGSRLPSLGSLIVSSESFQWPNTCYSRICC